MPSAMPHPPSPCTSLCVVDPDTEICAGCFRTLDEIAKWSQLTAEEKHRVLEAVEARRAAKGRE